jgi:hypothetical protein
MESTTTTMVRAVAPASSRVYSSAPQQASGSIGAGVRSDSGRWRQLTASVRCAAAAAAAAAAVAQALTIARTPTALATLSAMTTSTADETAEMAGTAAMAAAMTLRRLS